MKLKVDIEDSILDAFADKLPSAARKAEHAIAVRVAKDTKRYVPFLTGDLNKRTRVVENTIIYPGPYARYLYYGKVMVNIQTGKGPHHYRNSHGEDVIFFTEGTKLRPTERNLVFTTDFHPDAQAHWMEVSEAANKDKWAKYGAEELLKIYGK